MKIFCFLLIVSMFFVMGCVTYYKPTIESGDLVTLAKEEGYAGADIDVIKIDGLPLKNSSQSSFRLSSGGHKLLLKIGKRYKDPGRGVMMSPWTTAHTTKEIFYEFIAGYHYILVARCGVLQAGDSTNCDVSLKEDGLNVKSWKATIIAGPATRVIIN